MNRNLKPFADRLASGYPDASRRIIDDLAAFVGLTPDREDVPLDSAVGHSVVIDAGQSWRLVQESVESELTTESNAFTERVLGAGTRHFTTRGGVAWTWPPQVGYRYVLKPLGANKGTLLLDHQLLDDLQHASRAVRYASLRFSAEEQGVKDIERILIVVSPELEDYVARYNLVERFADGIARIRAKSSVRSGRPRVFALTDQIAMQEYESQRPLEAALSLEQEDPANPTPDDPSTLLIWNRMADLDSAAALLARWRDGDANDQSRQIHRIVHITSSYSTRVPRSMSELLDRRLFARTPEGGPDYQRDPLFVAIVPTIIAQPPDRRVLPTRALLLPEDESSVGPQDKRRGADDFFSRPDYRSMRDTTILTRRAIETDDTAEFDRWARNLFCCRVGLALSGGGACAYRTVPLIRHLQAEIGVDVLSGVSGGALLGAYHAADEQDHLQTAVASGPRFMRTLPLAVCTTQAIERVIDEDLGYLRLGETSIRFSPIAAELRADNVPRGIVLVEGTLGQGVRISGALPGLFAPTVVDGRRYSDGGGVSLVPASYLSCLGADITLACNCIPGPAHANLLRLSSEDGVARRLGNVLYSLLGRATDVLVWMSFAMKNAGSAFGRQADVFLEFEPSNIALRESGEWFASRKIVARGEAEMDKIADAVARLRSLWSRLL
ncbi:MAG: hypothetical protein K2Y51_08920 [Gammaproteobacteria bacterium]|nr:hypothetical protein [Gammaproteobacteria bacterium]